MSHLKQNKHLVIGAGSCGTAISYLVDKILEEKVDCFDIDAQRKILYGKRTNAISSDYDVYHVCVPEKFVPEIIGKLNRLDDKKEDSIVMIHSTMPVGQTRHLQERFSMEIIFNPLFFRDNNIPNDMTIPNRIVFGFKRKPESAPRIIESYKQKWIEGISKKHKTLPKVYYLKYEEAELVKLNTNTMRAMMITYFNELNTLFNKHGISELDDVLELLEPSKVLATYEGGKWGWKKEFLGTPYGGKCLPKDTLHMQNSSSENNLFEYLMKINEKHLKKGTLVSPELI